MVSTPNDDLMLVTRADLLALADKLADASEKKFAKSAALNMIAGTLLGPKHDWSRIKQAGPFSTSQRARKKALELPIETVALDKARDGKLKMTAKRLPDGSVEIATEDGHIVWIEFNDGCVKTHLYNNASNGPISIWSQPCHTPFVLTEGWEDERFHQESIVPIAGQDDRKFLGWQVDDPITGENWANRPSYEILPLSVALEDYNAALEAGETRFQMLPIYEGVIEEPTFL